MLEIKWKESAVSDLNTIFDYISDESIKAARDLHEKIRQQTNDLLDNPRIGKEGRVEDTRELVITSSYIIIYRFSANTIEILRILHTSRKYP